MKERADMIDHFGGSDVTTPATSLFGGFERLRVGELSTGIGGALPQGEYLYQRNGMATLNGILRTDSFTIMKVNADIIKIRSNLDQGTLIWGLSKEQQQIREPSPDLADQSPLI